MDTRSGVKPGGTSKFQKSRDLASGPTDAGQGYIDRREYLSQVGPQIVISLSLRPVRPALKRTGEKPIRMCLCQK